MATIEINGQNYQITGTAEDGLPIIKGVATSVHHKDEQGNQVFDKDGHPKISVNIQVPAAIIGVTPGENG